MLGKLSEPILFCLVIIMSMELVATVALRAFNNVYNAWIHRHDEQFEDDDPGEGEEHTQP